MWKICVLVCFVASSFAVAKPTFSKDPPVWPSAYTVTGVLYLPYAEIKEPFQAWYDASNKRSRIDYYGGSSLHHTNNIVIRIRLDIIKKI